MKPETAKTKALAAALLLGIALLPAYAAGRTSPKETSPPRAGGDFKAIDTNKDGYLSMDEFKEAGKDDLAFRAADINGDGRLDPVEYAKYVKAQASEN